MKSNCPICDEWDAIEVWVIKVPGENKKTYYFRCIKCKREWH